eukprot:gene6137-11329_t
MEIACYPGMDPLAVSGRVATANDGQFQLKGTYDVPTGKVELGDGDAKRGQTAVLCGLFVGRDA